MKKSISHIPYKRSNDWKEMIYEEEYFIELFSIQNFLTGKLMISFQTCWVGSRTLKSFNFFFKKNHSCTMEIKKKEKISRYLSAILEANGITCPILKMCNTDIRNLNNKSGNLYWLMRWKLSRKTFSQEQSSFYLAKMSLCDQRR